MERQPLNYDEQIYRKLWEKGSGNKGNLTILIRIQSALG